MGDAFNGALEMRAHFVGDVHGNFADLASALRMNRSNADFHVQVGDLGFFPRLGIEPPLLPMSYKDVYWIDGNHEDHDSISNRSNMPSSMIYCHRGEAKRIAGINFLFLGGGLSIDKASRTAGVDWFVNEEPSSDDYDAFVGNIHDADVIVTHEAPLFFMRNVVHSIYKEFSHVARSLEKIWQLHEVGKRDTIWICGHLHPSSVEIQKFEQTTFVCVPKVHDKFNPGIVLNL